MSDQSEHGRQHVVPITTAPPAQHFAVGTESGMGPGSVTVQLPGDHFRAAGWLDKAVAEELRAELEATRGRVVELVDLVDQAHRERDAAQAELGWWTSGRRRKGLPVVESVPDGLRHAAELVRAQGTEGGEAHDDLLRDAGMRLKALHDAASTLLAEAVILRAERDQAIRDLAGAMQEADEADEHHRAAANHVDQLGAALNAMEAEVEQLKRDRVALANMHNATAQLLAGAEAERDAAFATRAADPEGLIAERRELLVENERLRGQRDEAVADLSEDWHSAARCGVEGPLCPGCVIADMRPVVEAAKAWRAMRVGLPTKPKLEAAALIAAVDTWQQAQPGDTPGELVPGEHDVPLPVDALDDKTVLDSGALRVAKDLLTAQLRAQLSRVGAERDALLVEVERLRAELARVNGQRIVEAARALHEPTMQTVEWWHDQTGKGEALCCPSCRPEDPTLDWHPPEGGAGVEPEGFVPSYVLSPCPTLAAVDALGQEPAPTPYTGPGCCRAAYDSDGIKHDHPRVGEQPPGTHGVCSNCACTTEPKAGWRDCCWNPVGCRCARGGL